MTRQFEEQEFQASVSDQAGLLRSRVPTPMLHAIKAKHGDLIHYTLTGPDSVELKIMRGRGLSGERPYMSRESGNGTSKKSAKSAKGGAKSGGKKSAPAKSAGQKSKTKKKVAFSVPGFD